MNKPIGVIGIGLLGGAIAERLLHAGFPVIGYDINADRRAGLVAAGGEIVGSPAELTSSCQRIFVSLPNSSIGAEVLNSMHPAIQSGTLIIDTTTGSPEDAEAAAALLRSRGSGYMDACVGGSSKQTRAGDVVVMVGASDDDYQTAQDLFATFARRVFHLGPPGSGARMKLVFNMVLGLNRAVLAEGLNFAEHYGLPTSHVLEILKDGAAYSRVMDTKGPKMVDRSFYPPEARLSQHLKDVRLMLQEASKLKAYTPLTEIHNNLLLTAEKLGLGDADNSAVAEVFRTEPET